MITNEQFKAFLALGHELSGVEFKASGPRGDDYLRAKVARAIMGMTNRRDGGIVIVGVGERNGKLDPRGLSQSDLPSWKNYDHVTTAFANYMNPPASFDLNICQFDGNEFAVFEVHEFAEVPTICKKGYSKPHSNGYSEVVLREGVCYIRSRHKPETVEVSSLEQMRELLELATEKGVRKFVSQAQRGGMSLSRSVQPDDKELFDKQRQHWTSTLIEAIQSRGYWQVVIRPERFAKQRIQYPDLFPSLEKASVDLRGWDFPHVYNIPKFNKGSDWIGYETDWEYMREAWRFYQSAQFTQIAAMREDWPEQVKQLYLAKVGKPGEVLYVEDVIYRFTEIFAFASRLALTDAYASENYIHIDVLVGGIQGRHLISDRPIGGILFSTRHSLDIEEFFYEEDILRETLIASSKDLALQAAADLLYRAGFQTNRQALQEIQSHINVSY